MSKDENIFSDSKTEGLIPELRFPEFVNEGEWVQTTVEDNCLVKGRIGYRGYTTQDLVGQGEGALVLGGKHIQNQMLELRDPTYLTWEKYYESPEIMVEVGDIIFSQRGTLGDCAIIDREIGPATINPSMVLLKNITCDARFLYYILIGDKIQIEVRKNRAMGAIPMLSQKQIKEFPFLIPKNPQEQQKIATCLSSLDEVIAAHSQRLDLLKDHKKGLMQNLFPTNSITNNQLRITDENDQFVIRNSKTRNCPKYRFKEFVNDGEWVENELSYFCFNISSGKDKNCEGGQFELYGSTGIIGKTETASCRGDYILVARVGANAGLLNRAKGNFGVTDNTLIIDLKKVDSIDFIHYNLERIGLNKLVFGSGQPLITGGQLKSLLIVSPKSEKEQQKIATCLSSLDAIITAQTEKIEQLKLHKKGLMQGLFPNSITR
jgi:type I restriction enzyme S subunit